MDVRRSTTEWLGSLADRLGVTAGTLIAGSAAVVAAALGGWWAFATPTPPPVEEVLPLVDDAGPVVSTAPAPTVTTGNVVVHVDGAVNRPGVHELAVGSRVVDAVEAAGGLSADGDRERLNLAAPLTDGQRIWVPRVGEDEPAVVPITGGTGSDAAGDGEIVDLNTADAAGLETLPGVGPSIAAAIITHRDENGPFLRVDELLDVAGIGPSRLAQIEALVTV